MVKMKDSGIEWIGEIPETWKVCKQKYVMRLLNGRAYKDTEFEENGKYKILRVGNLSTNSKWYTSSLELEPDKYCKKGDLLYSWSMSYAPVIWNGEKVIYHYHIWKVLLENTLEKKFAYYYLLTLTNAIKSEIHETTMGFITMGVMNNSYIALPPFETQKLIANILDAKCGKIDSLRNDIQKQIETLEQYKKSVITEVVTKGINPDARMKDTNSKWIPKVPEHWKMDKLKYNLTVHEIKGYGDKEVLSLYRELGIVPKNSRDDNHNVTSEDTSKYKYVRKGDFVINKMKAWQGSVAVSDFEGIVSPAYYVYEFINDKYDKKYFHHLMRNKILADEFRRISGGIREGQWDLDRVQFENMYLPVPPIKEQIEIANFIESKYGNIEKSIELKQQQLETLEEYKKSLIFEYVTGKKEV